MVLFIVGHDLVCSTTVIVVGFLHHGDVRHLVDHVFQDRRDAMCKFLKSHMLSYHFVLH